MLWVLKEPSQWDGSFEHPKHLLKMMGKNIFTVYAEKIVNLNLWIKSVLYLPLPSLSTSAIIFLISSFFGSKPNALMAT